MMFIKFKEHFFSEDSVKTVKIVGNGVRVITSTGTYDIADVPEEDINTFTTCFTMRRRRYTEYSKVSLSKPETGPIEDPDMCKRYEKVNEEEE